ncbi:hypothetical protein [Pectobacterium aroidearum]|uniref:hypothetical protein n=1 Tax=Pectobacterium aroidearum TaxID=1201031 RepID=UPI0032EE5B6F
MKNILFLIFVILSSNSMADDKKSDTNDIPQQTVSVSTQPNVDSFNYFDDERNLAKLAEKISSLNKEKRDALEILEKVDSFYSKSFYNLLMLIIAMIGIVGVIIPLVISFYQTRTLKNQNANLKRNIDDEFSIKLSDLKDSIYDYNKGEMLRLENDVKNMMIKIERDYKIEIENLRAESLARINNTIAGTCLVNKHYKTSAKYYFQAGLNYIKYKNHYSLRHVIQNLMKKVIPNLLPNDSDESINEKYKKFINRLSEFNTESIYDDDISGLKSVWMEFLKRVESNDKKS